jgi:protein SCO1/2
VIQFLELRVVVFIFSALVVGAKTYPVDGIVVALDPAARTVLVSHRPIAGYMPAMTMPFRVANPSDLQGLYPGARVEFQLEIAHDHSVVHNLHKSGAPDAAIPAPKEILAIGEPVGSFHLLDQDGRPLDETTLKDKVVAINFIYTRCPLPDVCPRLSASFAALQHHFAQQSDVLLLSVTVDPDFDTPAVLAAYARRWSAGPHWRFLTGDVDSLASRLGEVYWSDEGSIGHNSITTLIGRSGRIAARIDGSSWRIDQIEDLISRELEHP